MQKINTDRILSNKTLFNLLVDTKKLYFEAVEQDDEGNIYLHKQSTYNIGGGYGTSDEYFLLTPDEYEQLKRNPRKRI